MISKEAINEFKQIYFEEYGIKLTDKVAHLKAISLLNFFKEIYRPVTPKAIKQ